MSDLAIQEQPAPPLRRSPLAKWWLYAACCLLGYLLYLWVLTPLLHYPIVLKERQTKQNLHLVENALAAYRLANAGRVPEDVNDLLTAGYLTQFPNNAFTGKPMHAIRFGDPDSPGNFIYITLMSEKFNYKGWIQPAEPCDYVLFGIGAPATGGQHFNTPEYAGTYLDTHYPLGIILVLGSRTYGCGGPSSTWMKSSRETLSDALIRTGYE